MNELKKLCSFKRTIGRKEFFFLFLAIWLYIIFSSFTFSTLIDSHPRLGLFSLFAIFHGYWMLLAAYVSRIRDIGKNPWLALIIFVPIINIIFLGFLFFATSQSKKF